MLSFICKTPSGAVVRLDDLLISDLQDIADKNGLESYFDLYLQPARFGKATEALYRFCCEQAGDKPPERITPRVILAAFEPAEDDLPTLFEDGLPSGEADGPTTD
jgi:hypothetical protein